jgi:Tfp pilus assembly protein PilF
MLAKPSACVLPLIALALHAIIPKRDLRRGAVRCLVICLVQAPFVWIAGCIQGREIQLGTPLAKRPLVALDALGFYLSKLFVPTGLGIDYGRAPSHVAAGLPMVLGTLFLLLLVAVASMRRLRRGGWALAGMLVFVAGLLPVLGLVPFDFQFYSTVADRYAYIAMSGPALLLTDLLGRRPRWGTGPRGAGLSIWRSAMATGVILLLALTSFVQTGVWVSDASLFQHALAVNIDSVAANQTLGYLAAQAAQQGGEAGSERDRLLRRALEFDNRALAVNPNNPRAHFNRANLFLRMGLPAKALADYSAAAGHLPEEAQVQNNWGVSCLQLDQNDTALRRFRLAVAADAHFADAYANAGTAFLRLGNLAQAREQFRRALAINPDQPQAISGLRKMQAMGRQRIEP